MLCVSGEAASTGNPAYPAQGLLNPYPAWPRLPVRCLYTTMMPQNSEYSLRIRLDGDTFSVKRQEPVLAKGIIMLREFPTIP